MFLCSNIKCPHYRVRKEIDYTAMMGMNPFGMPCMLNGFIPIIAV